MLQDDLASPRSFIPLVSPHRYIFLRRNLPSRKAPPFGRDIYEDETILVRRRHLRRTCERCEPPPLGSFPSLSCISWKNSIAFYEQRIRWNRRLKVPIDNKIYYTRPRCDKLFVRISTLARSSVANAYCNACFTRSSPWACAKRLLEIHG